MYDPLTRDRIPVNEKCHSLVRSGAGDSRRDGRAGCRAWGSGSLWALSLNGRDGRRYDVLFELPAGLRPPRLRCRVDDLAGFEDCLPVEDDLRMVCLDVPKDLWFERRPPDADTARRSEDIQDPRALPGALAVPVHEICGFVSALVADHP